MYDTAIIGGGAAGMAAAIFAAKRQKSVLLLERLPRVGKKLLATGNGRCNLSNQNISLKRYHGQHVGFAKYALETFPLEATKVFFSDMGLPLSEGAEGKLYPKSLQATSVLDLMRLSLQKHGVLETVNCFIQKIEPCGTFLKLVAENGETFQAKTVICAAGGKAAPSMGTDGSAYQMLSLLGHTIVRPFPSLVQIKTATPMRALKGTKHVGQVQVMRGDTVLQRANGEILFTDYGVSGPPVFNLSRIVSEHAGDKKMAISINFFPEYTAEALRDLFHARKTQCPHLEGESFLYGLLQKNIGREIVKRAHTIDEIAHLCHDFRLPVTGVMPWANAQVTAGGVDTKEVCPETMESYLVPGLYFCGEILDIDGDCGGFNLQWAWSSAYVAAQHI